MKFKKREIKFREPKNLNLQKGKMKLWDKKLNLINEKLNFDNQKT